MAKFEKGHQLAKGRPPGALNRTTEQMRLTINRAVNNTLNTIQSDLEELKKLHQDGYDWTANTTYVAYENGHTNWLRCVLQLTDGRLLSDNRDSTLRL